MSISIIVSGEDSTKVTVPSGASNTISIGQDLSDFVKKSETDVYYPASNPDGFITLTAFLNTITGYVQKDQTGTFVTDAELSGIESITGVLDTRSTLNSNAIVSQDIAIGALQQKTGDYLTTGNISPLVRDFDVSGDFQVSGGSTFYETVNLFPPQGRAITARSTNSNNPGIQAVFEGPVTVGHDLFQKAGFTNGFADGSNHFHALIDINRIEQASESDVKNIERVQERYYAITSNLLPNSKAAFWAWHKVARSIDTTNVDTSTATLDVSALQSSPNRSADSEVPFSTNVSPAKKSEDLVVTLDGHSFSSGESARMIFDQSFQGPIVAANLFGKVTATTTNTFNVELYGGNYKTTSQVPLGTDQTGLSFDFVTLQTIGTGTIVQNGNESNLQLYSKTNFTPHRLKDETLKATWSSAHGLVKNEHLLVLTDGRGDLSVKQSAYVLDPDPDNDGLSIIMVYGRRVEQTDISSFDAFGSSNWTIHKGSMDGIHDDTIGDNLFSFNANNVGEYNAYQIGPGCQTDVDCISIGKNVYNRETGTVKIGYDNEALNITSKGIDTSGQLTVTGNVGIGTTSPQAKLHVAGSGIITSDFAVDTNTLFVDASQNSVGIKTSSPRAGTALHVDDNFLVTNGNEDHLNIDTTSYIYKFGDISGGDNGSFFEVNSPNGVSFVQNANFGIGNTLPQESLDVKGNAIVSGNASASGTITSTSNVSRPIQNDEANDTTAIRNIRNITQTGYNALTGSGGEDANTLYIIVG